MDANAVPTVPDAADTLIAELEREHKWLSDLKADVARVEQRCGHLLNAADSALSALEWTDRRPFIERLRRLQIDRREIGRRPTDGRRDAVLTFLAEKGHGRVTNADIRKHLKGLGHQDTPSYVGNMVYKLAGEGLLLRSGYGEYTIAHDHEKLRLLRFRHDRRSAIEHERARRTAEAAAEDRQAGKNSNEVKRFEDIPGLRARIERELAEELEAEQQAEAEEARAHAATGPYSPRQTDRNGLYDPEW